MSVYLYKQNIDLENILELILVADNEEEALEQAEDYVVKQIIGGINDIRDTLRITISVKFKDRYEEIMNNRSITNKNLRIDALNTEFIYGYSVNDYYNDKEKVIEAILAKEVGETYDWWNKSKSYTLEQIDTNKKGIFSSATIYEKINK